MYNLDIVRALISRTGDPQRYALSFAAKRGHAPIVTCLLQVDRMSPDAKDEAGRSPLSYASGGGSLETVLALLPHSDINSLDTLQRSPLSYAAQYGCSNILIYFLQLENIRIDSRDSDGRSPLSYAAESGSLSSVVALLPHSDINSQDNALRSPLWHATARAHVDVVNQLLRCDGIEVDSKGSHGRSPLLYAAQYGFVDCFGALLPRSNTELRDKNGRNALSWAATGGSLEIFHMLLECSLKTAVADYRDDLGGTLLIYAAESGNPSLIKELLSGYDIDVNAVDIFWLFSAHLCRQ